ncbi:hypothetical protein Trydic_g20049 [Trypoxylus dichotomus]
MADKGTNYKLLKVSTRVSKCKVQINNATSRRNRNRALRRKRLFNVTDMNNVTNLTQEHSLKPPQEVAEWQYHHQLAYWKSRAISLEYENRMLHSHIKKMCTQEIQDYIDVVKEGNEYVQANEENVSSSEYEATDNSGESPDNNEGLAQVDKKLLYGEMESKINAMETAMKVNYNLQLERHKSQLWPNIPLNL